MKVVLACAAVAVGGCATALEAGVAPLVDTGGHVAGQGRADGVAAMGGEDAAYVDVGLGGGYRTREAADYALASAEVGIMTGYDRVGALGLAYTPRFIDGAPHRVRQAFGLHGRLLPLHDGAGKNALELGVGATVELELGGGEGTAAVFSLGLVGRWLTSDDRRVPFNF